MPKETVQMWKLLLSNDNTNVRKRKIW